MSRILTITLSALMLAGCAGTKADTYNKSAVPNATAELRQATAMCEKQQTPSKFIAAKFMACRQPLRLVGANRTLATSRYVVSARPCGRSKSPFRLISGQFLPISHLVSWPAACLRNR